MKLQKYFFILILILLLFSINSCASEKKISKTTSKTETKISSGKTYKSVKKRGLYIPCKYANSIRYIKKLLKTGNPLGINMVVTDIHHSNMKPKTNKKVLNLFKKNKIYTVARIVCFHLGLNKMPVSKNRMKKIYNLVDYAVKNKFDEIQLDYIRFQDGGGARYSLKKKYKFIENILINIKKQIGENKVKLSADVFGRIVYNRNDRIGQQLELFAKHLDVIYPMLYPSHFTNSKYKMRNPGKTITEGTLKGLARLKGKNTDIHPYIQCFKYNTQWARMSLTEYVKRQIVAVEDTDARGWVAWNARGNYKEVFSALKKIISK
jgi:hypothetical protein